MLHGIILIEFYNIFKILIGFENFNNGGPLNLPENGVEFRESV